MKIIFMGRKKHSAELIEWLLSKDVIIDSVVTDSHLPNSPTQNKANELGIPLVTLKQVEKKLGNSNHDIDLVVSYLFWKKIKEPVISSPKLGCINFHPAILPDWKGTAGYNIAILEKLKEWGATAHFIEESIDTGPIIEIFKFHFDYRIETALSLEEKTMSIQKDLFKKIFLDLIEGKELRGFKQEKKGIYISRRKMEEMKQIDINNDDIDLKIRAFWFPPYTGANITIKGEKYTLINDHILRQLSTKNDTNNLS